MSKKLPKRTENFALWYNELVKKADLAENSPVRGCMIIKPYGYAIWEKIKTILDQKLKETGHQNAYFPLFIPQSFFSKEAKHVHGFAKECAVITHYRLKNNEQNNQVTIDPEAKLEEPLIVRPTSETVIWESYKNWIQSYRDLPLLINQWANVVRWEMRTRPFIRSSEFLWQEGHTAHATKEEAITETKKMIQVYADFAQNYLAIPVIQGIKSLHEQFAGAERTHTIEMLMQDGKALQAGTSHFLGQNFSKAFDVKFTNKAGDIDFVWGSCWGVSSRLIGALIMTHADDDGLVLPPNIAPIAVVIIPIFKSGQDKNAVKKNAQNIQQMLSANNITSQIDDDENYQPGWKFSSWEIKGVPIRITIGPKDLQNHTLEIFRRDTKHKISINQSHCVPSVQQLLQTIQDDMCQKSMSFLEKNTHQVEDYNTFSHLLAHQGGFVKAFWDGTTATEKEIKTATKATIRCLVDAPIPPHATCIYSKQPAKKWAIFAKAY